MLEIAKSSSHLKTVCTGKETMLVIVNGERNVCIKIHVVNAMKLYNDLKWSAPRWAILIEDTEEIIYLRVRLLDALVEEQHIADRDWQAVQ